MYNFISQQDNSPFTLILNVEIFLCKIRFTGGERTNPISDHGIVEATRGISPYLFIYSFEVSHEEVPSELKVAKL